MYFYNAMGYQNNVEYKVFAMLHGDKAIDCGITTYDDGSDRLVFKGAAFNSISLAEVREFKFERN